MNPPNKTIRYMIVGDGGSRFAKDRDGYFKELISRNRKEADFFIRPNRELIAKYNEVKYKLRNVRYLICA